MKPRKHRTLQYHREESPGNNSVPLNQVEFALSLLVSHTNKISAGAELIRAVRCVRLENGTNGRVKRLVLDRQARGGRWHSRHGLGECLRWRWLLRDVYVAVFVSRAVREVLANFLRNFAEVDEAVSDVDQLRCGV